MEFENSGEQLRQRKLRREQLARKRIRRRRIRLVIGCLGLILLALCVFLLSSGQDEPSPSTDETPTPSAESVTETTSPATEAATEPPPSSETAQKSLLDFLKIAVQPVGSTMYVWGGGWNEADDGAGIEAVTLGVSERWAEFAAAQDSSYDYHDTEYQIHDGLDCSGYVGWAVYNVLETENGRDGYVLGATKMAKNYADRGLGEYIPTSDLTEWMPGDIMSMDGHVWIVVGMCDDGSVLFLHASPPGVIFCGTALPDGSKSQAVALAEQIMSTHYPAWYEKFPNCSRSHSYLTRSWAMRWSRDVLCDDEDLCGMTAEQIVNMIYN